MALDFGKYKVNTDDLKLVFPRRPILKKNATPNEIREHADLIEEHVKKKQLYQEQSLKIQRREGIVYQQFKIDALKDVGLADHPKAEKIFSYAWEKGHSSGYHEVYVELRDLVDSGII